MNCAACGYRYGTYFSSCPSCGASNNLVAHRRINGSGKKLGFVILVVGFAAGFVLLTPAIFSSTGSSGSLPAISILPQLGASPEIVPQDELVAAALEEINKDRKKFGLSPVELSSNIAAQVHAEDVFKNKQISHWMSNGEKPYMTYSRYGGMGGMGQNVAIAGFSADQYEECLRNPQYNCEKIDPIETIKELEYEMMYNDKECCNDGHRDNILDSFRTDVSIGVVYDQYYLVLVQNFENNYGIEIATEDQRVRVSGVLGFGSIDHIAIYFDPPPTPEIYEENKQASSYSTGALEAVVVRPAPFGFYYDRPDGYELIVARQWDVLDNGKINITFDIARAVERDGVYTISVIAKSDRGEVFDAASHSIWIIPE